MYVYVYTFLDNEPRKHDSQKLLECNFQKFFTVSVLEKLSL